MKINAINNLSNNLGILKTHFKSPKNLYKTSVGLFLGSTTLFLGANALDSLVYKSSLQEKTYLERRKPIDILESFAGALSILGTIFGGAGAIKEIDEKEKEYEEKEKIAV